MVVKTFKIPESITKIKASFSEYGKELFLVGGCVRDGILDITPKDFDLVTDALPDEIISICRGIRDVKHIVETGKSFGVINVITESDQFEIATYRCDSESSDGRRPDSVTFSDMKSDAFRRDLTINALYMDIDTKEVIDFVGGVDDIKMKIIRTVGVAEDRFLEDGLRVFRCIRFASRFGSELSYDIHQTLIKGVDLSKISMERIRDEFIKSIKSAISTADYIKLLQKYGLVDYVLPQIKISLDYGFDTKDVEAILSALLYDEMKSKDIHHIKKYLNTIKYPTDQIRVVAFMLSSLSFQPHKIRQFKKDQVLSDVAKERVVFFMEMMGLTEESIHVISKAFDYNLISSAEDIIKTHKISGKELGEMIDSIEIQGFINTL